MASTRPGNFRLKGIISLCSRREGPTIWSSARPADIKSGQQYLYRFLHCSKVISAVGGDLRQTWKQALQYLGKGVRAFLFPRLESILGLSVLVFFNFPGAAHPDSQGHGSIKAQRAHEPQDWGATDSAKAHVIASLASFRADCATFG